ncbi:helix-turn-helix domain-containing protein [Massilia sp. METH4]|uniref:helix-turn-helix domain-containing protein n=1 Tax=Massilia sp. METH4 TaxID=3123041 RepID=UPI0030D12CC1
MSNESALTAILRRQSSDIDEHARHLHNWEQEYRQLSCGKFSGVVSTASDPRVTILSEITNQSLHQQLTPPAGTVVLGAVLNRDNALLVDRRPVKTTSLMVVEGGREYDFRTEGSTELLGIILDDNIVSGVTRCRSELIECAIKQTVVPLAPDATMMLRHFWRMISCILQQKNVWPDNMPMPLLADTALTSVLLALSMSTGQTTPTLPQSAGRQAKVVREALRFMRANLHSGATIVDVCEAVHVSQRTLQYYFESCLGMSPRQYLRTMRLNAARRLLRTVRVQRSRYQVSIAEVAAQCGYDHPSRFAGDYKRQFGVLPSETLREAEAVIGGAQ